MIVKRFEESDGYVRVCSLADGKVFECNNVLYLKIDSMFDSKLAVSLKHGITKEFQKETRVKLVKGHFQETKD